MFTIRPNGKIFLLSISLKPLYNLEENLPVWHRTLLKN
jgi:hypothetical protein